MISQLHISYYKNLLLSVKVAKTKEQINIAKPIMLLSIIDGIRNNVIINNYIKFDNKLIGIYKELYVTYKRNKITPPEYPYYYLNSEDFYKIIGNVSKKTPSAKFLREQVEYAQLDETLWELLQNESIREEYTEAIIQHFLKR